MASSSRSPCAACICLRKKCKRECVFAPYFRPEDRHMFLMVHKVFGAANVAKLLNDLPVQDREDAMRSITYEAIARLNDPVFGCVGVISRLQQQLRPIQNEILNLRKELSANSGPAASSSLSPPQNSSGGGGGGGVEGEIPFGIPCTLVARPQTQMPLPQNQQQALHNQHIAAAISNYEQQEISNSMLGMDGRGSGAWSRVMTVVAGRYNLVSMMPSSSNNPPEAQPAESDHQNPQVSPAAAGASSVHHHRLSLQQMILQQQQQQYLEQQQGEVSPASAGASSVHFHHLSLLQQQQLHLQQQEGQEPALRLRDTGDDKHSAGPPSC